MVDFSLLASHGWFLALFAAIAALTIFPLVIIAVFLYDALVKKFPKTPKVLLMLACTFFATLIAAIILEIYLGYTLPQVFTAG